MGRLEYAYDVIDPARLYLQVAARRSTLAHVGFVTDHADARGPTPTMPAEEVGWVPRLRPPLTYPDKDG